MLDKYLVPRLRPPLQLMAKKLYKTGITADQLTIAGFITGLLAVPALAFGQFELALICLVLNRLADGLDGELARIGSPSDAGGYLDITLDFVFYSVFPLGFALYDPASNALPTAVLIASFVGTGASFLAFSTQAEKRSISNLHFPYKGLFYLDGLAEGTETIICFALMCLLPFWFDFIAWLFAALCFITTLNRVYSGYMTLRD